MAPSQSPDTKERCKPMAPTNSRIQYTSSGHIDPKMGHLKRVYMAVNRGDLECSQSVKDQACSAQSNTWTKVILQHPQACAVNLNDTFDVIWDSGASFCITNNIKDFITPIKPIEDASVNGINGPMSIIGSG